MPKCSKTTNEMLKTIRLISNTELHICNKVKFKKEKKTHLCRFCNFITNRKSTKDYHQLACAKKKIKDIQKGHQLNNCDIDAILHLVKSNKNFKCEICSKRFTKKSSLKIHSKGKCIQLQQSSNEYENSPALCSVAEPNTATAHSSDYAGDFYQDSAMIGTDYDNNDNLYDETGQYCDKFEMLNTSNEYENSPASSSVAEPNTATAHSSDYAGDFYEDSAMIGTDYDNNDNLYDETGQYCDKFEMLNTSNETSQRSSNLNDQINMLKALQAVHNGMSNRSAAVKFNVNQTTLRRQMDRHHAFLNIVEETLMVRCVRKVALAGFFITRRHISDSIEILFKTLQNAKSSHRGKIIYLTHLYRRQPSLLNYIEQGSNNDNSDDDESEKILSMLDSEFRACGLYGNDMRKQLKVCLQSEDNNGELDEDNQKRLEKRYSHHLQNDPKCDPKIKRLKLSLIPINSTPLVIANVRSNYTTESFVDNPTLDVPEQLDSTPTQRILTTVEEPAILNQSTSSFPVPEINHSLNASNVLDYVENLIGPEVVLRFYKNGQKKWPEDSNKGLFDLWKTIKSKADEEIDKRFESDDEDGLETDDVKIELVESTQ